MARTKFTSLDMVRFVKFSEENQHLKPLERLKKYNAEFPELSEEEKLANIKKWLGKELSEGMESLIEARKALPLQNVSGFFGDGNLKDSGLKQAEHITRLQIVDEIMKYVCERGGEYDINQQKYWLASYYNDLKKCPHCGRTEKCVGAPPEGCFLDIDSSVGG